METHKRITATNVSISFILLLLLCESSLAFYLPGVSPRDFQKGDELQVKVNKLSSTKTQLPYVYYFLDYCKPSKIRNSAENLGEVLRGDRIENSVFVGEKSSGVVPFGTMFSLVFLWFGISVPLVFVGSYIGFMKPAIEDPVKTNKISRQVPEKAWYMQSVFVILIGGILPFGAVFIELFFILTSIWLNQFYYIFGFLFIVFIILLITCAEITIVLCYFQLCGEDHRWWWRAYLTAGSSAIYIFLYSVYYFFTKLEITKVVSGILYFGYMLIVSYAFFVLTGTIGFYACLWFVRKIYSSLKID